MTENELKLFSMIEDIQILLKQLICANEWNVSWQPYNELFKKTDSMRKQILSQKETTQ